MSTGPFKYVEKTRLIQISTFLKPNARESNIVGIIDGGLHLQIAAQPRDNEANKELISFLSKILKVQKANMSILSGHKSREKIVSIADSKESDIEMYMERIKQS